MPRLTNPCAAFEIWYTAPPTELAGVLCTVFPSIRTSVLLHSTTQWHTQSKSVRNNRVTKKTGHAHRKDLRSNLEGSVALDSVPAESQQAVGSTAGYRANCTFRTVSHVRTTGRERWLPRRNHNKRRAVAMHRVAETPSDVDRTTLMIRSQTFQHVVSDPFTAHGRVHERPAHIYYQLRRLASRKKEMQLRTL